MKLDREDKWNLLLIAGHLLRIGAFIALGYFVGQYIRDNGIQSICETIWYGSDDLN